MQALRALRHLELHVVAVGERTEAISLDGREVNENVLPGILRDESESLRFTEPLHLATTHFSTTFPGRCPALLPSDRGRSRPATLAGTSGDRVRQQTKKPPDRTWRHRTLART